MSPERQAMITNALSSCPSGYATAQEIAAILHWKETTASFNLGILYFAKVVDRENVQQNGRQYRYWVRASAEAPITRGAWQPETVRIAERRDNSFTAALAAEADALAEGELA